MPSFQKMHGLGNDFVIFDQRIKLQKLQSETIQRLCNRRWGIGCDQLIVLENSERADVFMRIFNPDGSESEACGNATRCVAHILMSEMQSQVCEIETLRGILRCEMIGNLVRVDMGPPLDVYTSNQAFENLPQGMIVNMGNPHIVFFVENAEDIDLKDVGSKIERHEYFPHKTNVEFAHINKDGSIRLRVWERGAGITQACGSGACATMVASVHRGLVSPKADIYMDGGVREMQYTEGSSVFMTGPVSYVFDGITKEM